MKPSLDDLVARVLNALVLRDGATGGRARVMIGITGAPGVGKTTLAEALVTRLASELGPDGVAHVPMDGFHLADVALMQIGRLEAKGAPDTFDVHGYLALLRRLRLNEDPVIYAPAFDREVDQPVAGSILVPRSAQVIVSEGNYLLLDGPWRLARSFFEEVWYCKVDDFLRVSRLTARHVAFGKSAVEAAAWVATTDEPNARVIAATIDHADLVVTFAG